MSLLQNIRDGYSPEWKPLRVAVWNLLCATGGLICVIASLVEYMLGNKLDAIYLALMVVWAAKFERSPSNG